MCDTVTVSVLHELVFCVFVMNEGMNEGIKTWWVSERITAQLRTDR